MTAGAIHRAFRRSGTMVSGVARRALAGLAALVFLAPGALAAGVPVANLSEGSPRARLVLAEYASVGCPHCAHWAETVYPAFRAKYVVTGKVRFELHEMLTGDAPLAAAGFLTARCAGPTKYFQVVAAVYARQEEIAEKGAPALLTIARAAGLSDARFNACLADQAALKALGERTDADAHAHNVTATPTFFLNGRRLDDDQTLAKLDAAIAAASRR